MRETLLRVSRREQGASIQQFREGMDLMTRWLVTGLFGLLVTGLLPGVASAEGCPNEQFRTGVSANLPDCRAYEMVSPVDKNDGSIGPGGGSDPIWESSLDGSKMAYTSPQAFADAPTSAQTMQVYVASRAADGWSSHALFPSQAPGSFLPNAPMTEAFSSDLARSVLLDGGPREDGPGQDDPPLVAGEPPENPNLFVGDDNADGLYQLVDLTPTGVTAAQAIFDGSSPDLAHVLFLENAQLTANAPAGQTNLYEWSGGVLSLVSVLPGGEAIVGGTALEPQFISEDGSRVVFDHGGLYLREGGATTVQVDASQGAGPGGGGRFQAASGDGSRIFFTSDASSGLTNDTVAGSGQNLYEYDVLTGRLRDLTPAAQVEVQTGSVGRGVLGASHDGSYVYFVAAGNLAAGATVGGFNLYVWHEGTTTFIATLTPADAADWNATTSPYKVTNVTPDGTHLVFGSVARLTGYDNTDVNTGEADLEQFLYDTATHRLVCVSCNPSGARPEGSSVVGYSFYFEAGLAEGLNGTYRQRYLSNDGSRVFFDSSDSLVPQDANGKVDVYEYENGHVYLISGGTNGADSIFRDASASGDDVFFTTAQQLVGQDRDPRIDMYDARVGGGFAFARSTPCTGEACRPASAGAPEPAVPGSATFSGVGNLSIAPAAPVVKPKPKAKKPKAKKRRVKQKRHRRGKKSARSGRHGIGPSTKKRG